MLMTDIFSGAFEKRRVLVTGHTGFKGSWLCVWLRELGAEVIGYSLDPPTTPSNFELARLSDHIVDLRGDIRDAPRLTRVVEEHEPELVIHMAAQPLVRVALENPKETFDTNVGGTVNLLEAIRRTPSVRCCIAVTTDKVYEDRGWIWGYRENDSLGGNDPYSASKAMAELTVQAYRRTWAQAGFAANQMAIASVRAGNVIGGGDWATYRLVPDCIRDLMADRPIQVNTPDSVRPWMFVLEPLSGYLWVAAQLSGNVAALDGAWNFGPAEREAVTCQMLAEKANTLWGGQGIAVAQAPPRSVHHQTRVLRLNWDKAANDLKWSPAYTWEKALHETVDWYHQYQRRGEEPGAIDMYDVCVKQIRDYVDCANALGIPWAT